MLSNRLSVPRSVRLTTFIIIVAGMLLSAGTASTSEQGPDSTPARAGWGVSGTVFFDSFTDGVRNDPQDVGLEGWVVQLVHTATQQVFEATTDADGRYYFNSDLHDVWGPAVLREVLPSGYVQTAPLGGEHSVDLDSYIEYFPFDFGNTYPCDDFVAVYTDSLDFALGTGNHVVDRIDRLELLEDSPGAAYPYAWIANAYEGTVSKMNVRTGNEEGRYYTGPPTSGGDYGYLSPSRTAIDKDGNCWVLNRGKSDLSHQVKGSLTQILVDDYVDRDDDGLMDTCADVLPSGNPDGIVDLETEVLPWGEDERVARHYHVPTDLFSDSAKALVIDQSGMLWVGHFSSKLLRQYDPNLDPDQYGPLPQNEPTALATLDFTGLTQRGPYGLALGCNGLLYMATHSAEVFEIDPAVPAILQTVVLPSEDIFEDGEGYGIAVDKEGIVWVARSNHSVNGSIMGGCYRWDPLAGQTGLTFVPSGMPFSAGRGITVTDDGYVWMATNDPEGVARFSTDTPAFDFHVPLDLLVMVGVGIDLDGNVIAVSQGSDAWVKLSPVDGAILPVAGPMVVGDYPYTYSDFTGNLHGLAAEQAGDWTVVTDGMSSGFRWHDISWDSVEPVGTEIIVEGRAADEVSGLTGPRKLLVSGPQDPPLTGRYLETRTRLIRDIAGCNEPFVTPELLELTAEGDCDTCYVVGISGITVNCESPAGAVVDYSPPVLMGDCDELYGVVCTPPSGSLFPIGQTLVECQALDLDGGTVSGEFVVTVLGACIPTPTGCCCLPSGNQVLTEVQCSAGGGVYMGDGTDCSAGCEHGCTRPPKGLAAWFPLDSINGGIVENLAEFMADGISLGGTSLLTGEKVTNSYQFDGSNDYLEVPDDASLDLGTSDFSIDAWVKTSAMGFNPIVDKRGHPTASTYPGYILTIHDGYPWLQIGDTGGYWNFFLDASQPASFVADGQWHLIAVTVNRNAADGIVFYVDGQPFVPANNNPTAYQGSLDNDNALWIGRDRYSGADFNGAIDEVEIYRRRLKATEVEAIHLADSQGKCRETCYVSRFYHCCRSDRVGTTAVICNYTNEPHVYSWGIEPTTGGLGCDRALSWYSPASGTVTVPARGRVEIPIQVECPSDLRHRENACFQMSVYNHDTARLFGCVGGVWRSRWFCPWIERANVPTHSDFHELPPFVPVPFEWKIENIGGDPGVTSFAYEIRAVADEADSLDTAISLNGLAPGAVVRDQVEILPGATATIPLNIEITELWPLALERVQLFTDEDQDGTMEPISELALQTVLNPVSAVEDPGDEIPRPTRPFRSLPNPFNPVAEISFEIAGPASVPVSLRIYDIRGRMVRTIYSNTVMAPGIKSVIWKGVDDGGRKLASGVYLLQLVTPSGADMVKVVLLK